MPDDVFTEEFAQVTRSGWYRFWCSPSEPPGACTFFRVLVPMVDENGKHAEEWTERDSLGFVTRRWWQL